VALLTITLLAGVWNPAYAAKKKGYEKLKFPPLNEFKLPEIQKADLANGIKLRLIKDDKLPMVNLRIMLKGGDAYEPPDKVGATSITAQLLRIGGTKDMKPDELDKLLDANGISISSGAGADNFYINLTCLEENFDEALSILAKILKTPAFDKEKLEEIKTQESTGISRRNDQPGSINSREFNKLIYGATSPFAAQLEYEHLDNIGMSDIAFVYRSFFAADNMLVGVTGPLEIDTFKKLFEKHFGSWNTKAKIPPFPKAKEQKYDFKVAFAQKSNINQSYLSIGHLGIEDNLEERAKISVFNSIFSQGFSSRLMGRVRVKMGLTYGIGGGINANILYPGKTSFTTFTKSESTIDAIKAIFDEISLIVKEKVTEKELKDAKDYFLNSFVFRYRSPSRILNRSLNREFYGIPQDIDKKFLEGIKNVTADDVLATAKSYLHPDKMIVLVVGNKEKIKGELSEIGKVKEIDIKIKPPALKEKIPEATPETLAKGKKIIGQLAAKQYKGYKGLKSMETKLDMSMTMQGRTMNMSVTSKVVYPGKSYSEIQIMGMTIKQVINGDKGFMEQMGNKRPMPAEDIKKNRFGSTWSIFNEKGKYKFQYLKEEKIDGKVYDVIYTFDDEKNWIKFFINRESGLIEIEEKMQSMFGQTSIVRMIASDFKTVKGIPISFKTVYLQKGKKVREITIKEVKVNPKIDMSLFKIDK
jgi:predicted Zn-dependent peptidase